MAAKIKVYRHKKNRRSFLGVLRPSSMVRNSYCEDDNATDSDEGQLAGGPKHRKAGSMPESFYVDEALPPTAKDVTVTRSHSDSRKRPSQPPLSLAEMREGVSAEEIEKLRGDLVMRRRKSMKKTTSLPSCMAEAGTTLDSSPQPSPVTSPVPDTNTSSLHDDSQMSDTYMFGPETPVRAGGPMNFTTPETRHPLQVVSPHQVDVISMEDDEFTSEDEHLDEHGPFGDLNVLKHKPAHLTVFLHYLISNSDPSPLLFYLVTENYNTGNMKEMRRWAYEIHSTFLINSAPLRVNVDDGLVANMDNVLLNKYDKEDSLRSVFTIARHVAQSEISELLADFRNKRALGLGSLYGDHELQDENMTKATEQQIIEKYLVPHFERLMKEVNSDRNQAMASALATFLKQVGVQLSSKNAALLERCPSFTAKDKKMFRFGSKTKQKYHMVKNHQFTAQHYYTVTNCHHCANTIWGIGNQGYQCINCEYNVHKQCMDVIKENCNGRKQKDRHSRKSMLANIMRKPSSNNPAARSIFHLNLENHQFHRVPPYVAAVREAQRNLEGEKDIGVTSPGASAPSSVFHVNRNEEDEDASRKSDRFSDLVRSPEDSRNSTASTVRGGSPVPPDTDDQNDVHVDEHTLKALNQSGSSSNSSISGSFESPNNSHEILSSDLSRSVIKEDDSDFDTESELPRLEDTIPSEVLKRLKPKEKKRQDVINELFYTERSHVRNLKVMYQVFYRPMLQQDFVPNDLVRLLFPNLHEVIEVHGLLNSGFKSRRKDGIVVNDVADILLDRFSGDAGEQFKKALAQFCSRQSLALDSLRSRMKKDAKLATYLQELSANPLCRRLELKDLIPSVMQRLTKYPLLIENLMKYTTTTIDEYEKLQRALELSKTILNHVNQAVKVEEDNQRLLDIMKRLDRRPIENITHPVVMEYKNLDLTRHKMIHDGSLTWRIGQKKLIDLHVVLLEDILVLLQKQDEKLVLKCQSTTVVAGKEDTKFTHSPIIKLTNLLTRNVATDKRAFFLVSTSELGPQIYELVASSVDDKNKWFKYISEATDAYKGKDGGRQRRPGISARPPPSPSVPQREDEEPPETPSRKESREESQTVMPDTIEEEDQEADRSHLSTLERNRSSSVDSLEHMKVEVQQINHPELIQPNEVVVMDTPFERAQPVMTPMEKLKRRDEMVKEALEDKQKLVSEILQLPEGEFDNIADVAGEIEGEKEAKELVLVAISQANKLAQLLSAALVLTEENAASGGGSSGPSWSSDDKALCVQVPSHKLNSIATLLNRNLTELLGVVTSREREKDHLQQQLRLAEEQLTLLRDTPRSPSTSVASRPNSFASVASSTTSEDIPDHGQSLPQVELTQNVEIEQFVTVTTTSVESDDPTTPTTPVATSVVPPGSPDVAPTADMLSSVSSESQDGEEGFHDAQTDNDPPGGESSQHTESAN